MATYREVVYMCLDEVKLISDDSHFTEEHVLFLLDKYRALILKQRYSDIRKDIPESNLQTICIDLEHISEINGIPCTGADYLRSTKPIPHMMSIGTQKVTPLDYFQGNLNYISNERFRYAGTSKFTKNQAFATIAPDSYLYIKSQNPQTYYLRKAKLTGIFEDSSKLSEFSCDDNSPCDVMDMRFPLEESLISVVIELIVKELTAAKYQAADIENNANDDTSDIATWIKQQMLAGRKAQLYSTP